MAVSRLKYGRDKKGSGKCTGTEREKEGAGSGFPKVAGSERKRTTWPFNEALLTITRRKLGRVVQNF